MRSQQKGELRLLAITRSQKITRSTTEPVVSFFGRRRQFLLVRIDNEHGQQFRGFGLARVLTNGVAIAGHLGEVFPFAIGNDRGIINRTSDRSFENGRIDKSWLGTCVARRRASWTLLTQYAIGASPGCM